LEDLQREENKGEERGMERERSGRMEAKAEKRRYLYLKIILHI